MNVTALLHAEFNRQKRQAFAWGTRDCLGWCADCALAITGRDPMVALRGSYDSEISAQRLMIENGWHDMGEVAASMFAEIPVAQAHTGDWTHLRNPDGTDGLGVVVGALIVARAQDSLGFHRLSTAQRAFRVA